MRLAKRMFTLILAWRRALLPLTVLAVSTLTIATLASLRPAPVSLDVSWQIEAPARLVTREGIPLSVTYQHGWNIHDRLKLHEIPRMLQISLLYAEDQRFFEHAGIDWKARLHALMQNIAAMRAVRGASTISEQTVRMLHPRPRTLWSRWLEGFEAGRMERRYSKSEILELYLNQVPYAANRRGVAQAARYFFNRSVDTLSLNEMLALAVMVRAPSRFDLWRNPERIRSRVDILATRLEVAGVINRRQLEHALSSSLALERIRPRR